MVKYRKKVLVGKLAERLKEIVKEVVQHFGVEIIEQKMDKEHIHILKWIPISASAFYHL